MAGRNDGDDSAGSGVPPKLTVSQRLLTTLPNLQRQRTPPTGRAGANGSDAVEPDEVIDPGPRPSSARPSSSSTRSAPYRPTPRANPYAEMSVADLRQAMKRLDDRERYVPLFIGPVLVALDLLLTAVAIHDNPPLHHKNHADPSLILAVGIGSAVIALLVVLSAFFRRRSFTIFALLFGGYGGGLVTMIPSWVVAGWLFIRFNRMQKALVAKTGGPASARQAAGQARAERLAARRKALDERRRTGRRGTSAPAPVGPPPNKRYTPPRPTAPGAKGRPEPS